MLFRSELDEDVVLDDFALELRGFEADGVDDELLLDGEEGVEVEAGLRPHVGEGGGHGADETTSGGPAWGAEESSAGGLVRLFGSVFVDRVGRVRGCVEGDEHLACTVAVVVANRNARAVNWQLFKVRAIVTVELGVKVGEDTSLKERIICEIDTSNDVTRLELAFLSVLKS